MKFKRCLRIFVSFVLICLFHLSYLFAQKPKVDFEHISVEKGLSQSGVISIAQDNLGFMWFGTRDGLNKYDTRNIQIFINIPSDSSSLSSSFNIYSILSDSKGRLWIGTTKGLNLYQPLTNNFKRFLHHNKNPKSISNDVIRCVFEDRQQRLWVGTDSGLNMLDQNGKFQHFFKEKSPSQGLAHNQVKAIYQDQLNNIWIGTTGGLSKISFKNQKIIFKNYRNLKNPKIGLTDEHVTSITGDSLNNIWIGTHLGGLVMFNHSTNRFSHFLHKAEDSNTLTSNIVRKVLFDNQNKLWIATIKGISIYDPINKKFHLYQHDSESDKSLNQNSTYDLFKDKTGNIWVGTYYGGVNVHYAKTTAFQTYQYRTSANSISSNIVRSLVEDKDQNLWIGTEAEGLNKLDVKTGEFTNYKSDINNPYSLSSNLIKSVFINDDGKIWVGSHDGGLDILDPKTGKSFSDYQTKLSVKDLQIIYKDLRNKLWIGTFTRGLFFFNEDTNQFVSLLNAKKGLSLAQNFIKNLFMDESKNFWVSTDNGLFYLAHDSKKFIDIGKSIGLKSADINLVTQDRMGRIWIGTYADGLIFFDSVGKSYSKYTLEQGLPSNNVLGIIQDDNGVLWLSTDNGLSKFDGRNFKNYTIEDGLKGNVFNNNAALKATNGVIYFGGYNGIVSFKPTDITETPNVFPIVFTGLKLFNKSVNIADKTGLLTQNISLTKKISFTYDQNIFTIDFALLNFVKSQKNAYAYKLEGLDQDWNYVDIPSATFTNLSAGTYKLKVKAKNNDGFWSKEPAVLIINVKAPFWKTWWAYITYLLFFAFIFTVIIRYLIIRERLKKENDLHQMKLNFFTNVSHEIRTPLTLIMGPLESLINYSQDNDFANRQLLTVKNNANRLSRLVNELLDFRKTEVGKLKLNIASCNIVHFAREIFLSFQHIAIEHQIDYEFSSDLEEIELYFDKQQCEKIIFNLLSNAFKFTPDGGEIAVFIKEADNCVLITVTDNGRGIPEEHREKLFTDFYQIEDFSERNIGTGIGLSLSKRIAKLHHGDISLGPQSSDEGSVFIFKLQKGINHFDEKQINFSNKNSDDSSYYSFDKSHTKKQESELPSISIVKKKELVLIVEDNHDVRNFISQTLNEYQILEAKDGLIGWNLAIEHIPDIIISDIMMPGMDGLELCRKLKTDDRTSHIPVALLTARSENIHQVSGLKTGADAYLTKPFSIQILQLTVQNLLISREKMRKKFVTLMSLEPTNTIIESHDQDFLNRVITQVEENLSNADFGVNELATEIGMSTPVFYKKIKSLTDMSVNNFTKTIRLKRAAQLLEQQVFTVYQISYEVGFNDTRYFAKEFKKQFGKLPSAYLSEIKNQDLETGSEE